MRGIRLLSGMVAAVAVGWIARPAPAAEGPGQIVMFNLSGPILEAPSEFDLFALEQSKTLHDLLERFRRVKKDEAVKAVVVTFDSPMLGWGQMQELRQALKDLRSADKEAYVYLEEASGGLYQLAAAGSKLVMSPTGTLDLTGLHAEQTYFKGLLDKIGVVADFEHVGAYKGAGEPFTRTEPSPEAREMMEWLFKDLFDQMVTGIAESRQMTPEHVRELIDAGPYTAKEALKAKLIDETAYVEDFVRTLRRRYGENVKFVYNYGARKGPEIDLSNPFAFFKIFSEAMQPGKTAAKPAIGIVYLDGMIMTGKTEPGFFGPSGLVGSTTIRRVLNKARDDDSIKAVVFRVDSPGGSALASDIIWNAARELSARKPLVVSMGNVAASGGYYVSMGAKTIFADPATLTGSIGVVGGKLVTKGLWDWAGVSFHEYSYGKNADLMNSNRKWDDRQRAIMRKYMEDIYGEFTDRVRKGRGDRLKKDLEELAGGRVYTGKQALALGLVDKLGGLQDAVKFAAAGANLSDYDIRLLPEKKNFIDLLMKSLMGQSPEDEEVAVQALPRLGWTLQASAVRELLPALRQMDPFKARAVIRSLMRIELLAREGTLMVLPAEITVR
ncbi:MAG: putative protease IV SppA [Phycisphaerae bacterium]